MSNSAPLFSSLGYRPTYIQSKLVVLQGNHTQTQCMRQNTRGYEFYDGVAACQGWEGKVGVYDTHAVWKRVLIELVYIYIHCLAQS